MRIEEQRQDQILNVADLEYCTVARGTETNSDYDKLGVLELENLILTSREYCTVAGGTEARSDFDKQSC